MLNDQRISEEELYDLRMKIHHAVEDNLEAFFAEMEEGNVYPPEMWEIGKKNSMFRLSLPTQYNGADLCLKQYFTVLEEIGGGNQAIRMPFHIASGLSWEVTAEHSTEEMKNEYLPKTGTGDFFVAFALTEPDRGPGADVHSTAVRRGDKQVLSGRKTLTSFTDVCDAYYITAVSDEGKRKKGGHTAFYVPADAERLKVESMLRMMDCRSTEHGDVIMEDMEIPDKYHPGAEGEGLTVFPRAPAVSRASIDICLLGLSQRMLGLTIARAKDRVTFGEALIRRQAVQRTLIDMAMQVHTLWLLMRDYAQKADRDEGIEVISLMVKLHGIDTVRTMSGGCLGVFGGIEYFEDNLHGPVECLYRDVCATWFGKGPHTVQCLILVRKVIDTDGEIRMPNCC